MLTPSMPEPWNGPGVHRHLAASLFGASHSMQVRWRMIPSLARWGISFLRNSTASRFYSAVEDNYHLARYSRDKTLAFIERLGARYELLDSGTLCVFRRAAGMKERLATSKYLSRFGMDFREIGRDEIVAIEPALGDVTNELAGGIWLPGDAIGDAHLFCRELECEVLAGGGEINTGMQVSRLVVRNGVMTGVDTNRGRIDAQRVVVAGGARSPELLREVGVPMPVKPAKGYSLTFDCTGIAGSPGVAIVDEAAHAVISPFGNRLRVVGSAEFAGFDKTIPSTRMDHLFGILQSLLPALAAQVDRGQALPWAGFRPMSSDGRPHIGASAIDGLYVNCGHGALGWTMAMGSAHVLADQLLGERPAIDHRPFLPGRD
jgi:D-amino-acid dehydrogenase